jgi:hypothetical protein
MLTKSRDASSPSPRAKVGTFASGRSGVGGGIGPEGIDLDARAQARLEQEGPGNRIAPGSWPSPWGFWTGGAARH